MYKKFRENSKSTIHQFEKLILIWENPDPFKQLLLWRVQNLTDF